MTSNKKKILLIDNEAGLCRLMEQVLLDEGYLAKAYTSPQKAMDNFKPDQWDLVITDIKMPGMSGLEVLQKVKESSKDLPVIMITAYATVEMSIQALRKGAYDMLTKPFEPEELVFRVKNALQHSTLQEENRELRRELSDKFCFDKIIGVSDRLKSVLGKVEKVAVRDTSVLITGESGTGKELIAQAIHYNSPRREKKFVAINCGALPASLLESELFGYKKGAFTGAKENRQGLLEAADGGTLFLDEVGNLPMDVQKTLLRFLEEKEFLRIGETKTTKVDVRLLSATNRDMKQAVKSGEFREDLFYRLNVVNIHMPPLREGIEDIPLLAAYFIKLQNEKFGAKIKGFEKDAMQALCNFDWPGNIRQLKNVIEACMAMESEGYISLEVLEQFLDVTKVSNDMLPITTEKGDELSYNMALGCFEIDLLKGLLRKHGGNIEAAAQEAGINMVTIYRKIKKYAIRKEDFL
ncbi:MAG: sigma-54 dependent transcriptional regulator [Desulfuromonadaceae bacterium]|nr:sigma-54 dependent transcriptional regulator [Desulfuromonadaceae bacterium]